MRRRMFNRGQKEREKVFSHLFSNIHISFIVTMKMRGRGRAKKHTDISIKKEKATKTTTTKTETKNMRSLF